VSDFRIHPQLLADCHHLGRLPASHLLLHRNAALPWLILVPETDLANLLDLPTTQRDAVLSDCKRVSDYLKANLGSTRINVAWIGNLVPQLHVHVIGRRPGDPCWPKPVWGHLEQAASYGSGDLREIASDLLGPGVPSVAKSPPWRTLDPEPPSRR
jgi:diadenosine tetraphosphate (Ap4A) HIT family hydrolase